MLLCLMMVLTLLPTTVLADAASAGGRMGNVAPDGATADTWYQDDATKVSGSVDPAVVDSKLQLTAVPGNANNCNDTPAPAFFRNEQLDAAIAAAGEGERELSFDMTPDATGERICLGFSLNYTSRTSNVFIGYNTVGSWFVQYYGGTGTYPSFTGPELQKGETYHITIKWTDEKITLFQIDDTVCEMPNDGGFGNVDVADAVGFKCGKDTETGSVTSMEISNLHYTGQTAAETVLPDGVLADDWHQDAQTVRGTGSICEVTEDDHLHLKVGSGNANNGDAWTGADSGTGPAVFLSEKMAENLAPNEDGNYVVSFKVKPLADSCWGIYLNYQDPLHGFLVGYNNPGGGWYQQSYNGTGSVYSFIENPTLEVGETYEVEVSWNPNNKVATVKFGDTALGTDMSYSAVCESISDPEDGIINNFAIKVGKGSDGAMGEVEIWDLHYTGQQEEVVPPTPTTFTVSGVVKCDNDPVPGASVTMNGKTVTTNSNGVYSFARVADGTYLITVSADGYDDASAAVSVSGADVTKNFSLSHQTCTQLPTDGVTDDEWVRDTAADTAKTGTNNWVLEKVDGQVHLVSGSMDGNSHTTSAASNWPGMFYNKTANDALAQTTGNRWIEFTFVRAEGSTPRFGVILNYTNPGAGFFVGCNDESGWFYEDYDAGPWSSKAGTTPAAGEETTIYVEWNNTTLVSFKQNGDVLFSNIALSGTGTGAAFRMTSWSGSPNEVYIKEMHYSGQSTVDAYEVSGTVQDNSGNVIEGATVSAGKYSTTTNADGSYTLMLPVGDQIIIASKDGYETETKQITVNGVQTASFSLRRLPTVSGTVTCGGEPVRGAVVTLMNGDEVFRSATTDAQGNYIIIGVTEGTYTLVAEAGGYRYAEDQENLAVEVNGDVTGQNFVLVEELGDYYELNTETMTVLVDQHFPRVIRYILNPGENQNTMWGQSDVLDTLNLNGVAVVPAVESEVVSAKRVNYTMTVDETNNNGTNLNVVISAHIEVGIDGGDNTLGFYIDDVNYTKGDRLSNPLQTIEVPNHSLVSVRSTEAERVSVTVAKPGGGTYTNGDATYSACEETGLNMGLEWTGNYFAGFVYNDELSAGLASNSEYGSESGGSDNYPVQITFEPKNNGVVESLALSSTLWYWDRKVSSVNSGKWENSHISTEQSVIGPEENELPFAKVSIAVGDQNGDETVDWQDGAIVYRDTVMHKPANSEGVRDAVSMRISMNFGGQAANPFLLALDNVKRVALSTDGLGQMILLKGYASEGHDSGHPDYYNIGERMGGVEDFNTMLEEGAKLGAQFGIHVNASEFYPEAQAFDEATVGRDSSNNLRYGWNWLDQGVNMNVLYDMASGNRAERFQKLYDLVGDRLTFVYVDVWGNNQHGVGEDAWMTRKLTNEIVNNTGWRIAHEWSYANPYDSTFQHWTSDYTYGGAGYKGHNNSNVMRFLLNSYKDSFPADFATYGGVCNAPLLGGPSMQGFEGWQKDDEYDLTIENTFNQLVATKFLQHYDIMQWINAENSVTIPYNANANSARTSTGTWTPEMQIVLKDQTTDDEVIVTRGLDAELDTTASFSLANEVEYRSRVITLNGKVILTGAPASAGEDKAFTAATQKYLIPWYWDADGERVSAIDEKLFHWNALGGSSTWQLPDGWESLSTVILYELSDQGRVSPVTVSVSSGWITLPASVKANTGYVVVKGEENLGPQFEWSTGLHVKDASFNVDFPNSYWDTTGTVERVNNPGGISVVHLNGDASVSQVMTDLIPGQKYVTYVAVDNLAGIAKITITDEDGNVLAGNYTAESIAINYVSSYHLHTAAGLATTGGFRENRESRFQNMYVFFIPEAGKTYTMTLSHEGDGDAYFDDVRTLTTKADNFTTDALGGMLSFTQDFENVAQGEYPFVVSNIEGVEDNRQHLSELHAPYTQAGWDVKMMDDVIDGNWSLKVNGLAGYGRLVFQTIPQNVRFEPGETYTVEFDYEMGTDDSYWIAVGDAAWTGVDSASKWYALGKTLDVNNIKNANDPSIAKAPVGHVSIQVTGAESGQTWIGIFSYKAADTQGTSGSAANFGGYQDFVLDNLTITYTGSLGNIDGTITAENGSAIPGASVTLSNEHGTRTATVAADSNGVYVFENLKPGTYSATVTAKGYLSQTGTITISGDGTVTKDFTLALHVHDWNEGEVTKEATCAGAGEITYTCAVCGETRVEEIPALAHDALHHVEAKDATETEEGNIEYWYCETCDKYFSDADAKTEITQAETVIPVLTVDPPVVVVPPVPPVIPSEPPEETDDPEIPDEDIDEPDTPLGDLPFLDVSVDAWYAQSIASVVALGFMDGTSEMTFSPRAALNRGMMAQILHNMAENPEATVKAPFADLDSKYYTEAVAWGAANGILLGLTETNYGGEKNLTREQMATMLYRYAGVQGLDLTAEEGVLDSFADGETVSGWAADAMSWAVTNGLFQGRTNGNLDPMANITRAEAAAVLDRYAKMFLA